MRFTTKILPSRSGNIGILMLNNPRPLHALGLDMIHLFQDILPKWYADESFAAVIVKSSGTEKAKAFCSGGDVKQVYLSCLEDRQKGIKIGQGMPGVESAEFFRQEYFVNHMMASASKPQISFWDGIVMGGGVGISIHGKYRVATENSIFAMPETQIGLFPDIGSCYWMTRMLPSSTAVFLALTGHRLKPEDLIYSGLATHYIPSERLEDLEKDLVSTSESFTGGSEKDFCEPLLNLYNQTPPVKPNESFLALKKSEIDASFGILENNVKNVEDIVQSLEKNDSSFAQDTLRTLQKMSPTSMEVALEGLRRAEDLAMEFRMSQACMRETSDFHEGIRAALVDKDRNPMWKPDNLSDVKNIDEYFAPIEYEWELPPTSNL